MVYSQSVTATPSSSAAPRNARVRIGAIALLGRSHATKVGVFGDRAMATSVCTSCGQCVATCPTGALRPKEAARPIVRAVETTCPYCGVGCGIESRVTESGRLAETTAARDARTTSCWSR